MKNKKILLTISIILVAAILSIVGWLNLPETLVLQITVSGEAGTTLPKIAGLAIPFLLSALFAVLYYLHGSKKYLLISAIGIVMYGVIFLMN